MWIDFPYYFWTVGSIWVVGILCLLVSYVRSGWDKTALILFFTGWVILLVFVISLWIKLERPPMRTLGETRLWYASFLPLVGLVSYFRWKFKWFLIYCIAMAGLFLLINYLNPMTYSKTLMPALQSIWFVPHVLVYLLAYALLAAASLVAIRGIFNKRPVGTGIRIDLADNLVYIGFSFLTLGLLFGALWAKEAWGHYWTWDPKEIWAFLTWMGYLVYIHIRYFQPNKRRMAMVILITTFIILLICWFGVNYLPVAQNSVHTYTQ